MRARSCLLFAILWMACGTASHYNVAVGARGPFPGRPKSCRTSSAESASRLRIEGGESFTAIATGDAEADCGGGQSFVFEIRKVARLTLSAQRIDGDYVELTLDAYDEKGRELFLGDYTDIDWRVPVGLQGRPGCHGDIIPICDPPYIIAVRPSRVGDHRVVVRFGGLEESVDIDSM